MTVLPSVSGVIDAHTHAWPPGHTRGGIAAPSWPDLFEALDVGGLVSRVVLITPGMPPGDDTWTAAVAARHPQQVKAVTRSIAPRDVAWGVRVVVEPSPTADDVIEAASDIGASVTIQNTTQEWSRVRQWAKRHEHITFLVDHLGHPDVAAGPQSAIWSSFLGLADLHNVFVKLPNLVRFADGLGNVDAITPFLERVLDAFGRERLLWASDWPNTDSVPYARLLDAAVHTVRSVDQQAVELVFRRNAAALLGGTPSASAT